MIQGTTPTHQFTIPMDASSVQKVRVTYAQKDNVLLVKEDKDCRVEGNMIETKLSQEETLLFDEFSSVQIQVRVLTTAGDALASDLLRVPTGAILDKEVLG
jgi:hypothetical protein